MAARTLMIQGTASSVGKSLIVAALCRIFRERGLRVAPFKSQNMALNSYVTPDGGEIGRAQAVQAEAARIEPSVEMNPLLLKPERGMRSQVVMLGRPVGSMTWEEYHRRGGEFRRVIAESLAKLRASYDLVIIEGAGNPAEVNLKSRDIVNMYVAELAGAPVVLLGDIDRGGVFAQLVGTMELFEPRERSRVAAVLINKFRGERAILQPGLDFLSHRLDIPVLGVIPFIERLRIADEDSVALEDRARRTHKSDASVEIGVVRLPTISNYDDFLTLEHERGVALRFVETVAEISHADLVVIPGSKCTVADLGWLKRNGFAEAIAARAGRGEPILGICGGCQILGQTIEDPDRVESAETVTSGLGLLPLRTRFERIKRTARVMARSESASFLGDSEMLRHELSGYEIHMGRVEATRPVGAAFRILMRNGEPVEALDGAVSENGAIVGTMLHGIFEDDHLRRALIANLAERKGFAASTVHELPTREQEYDRLAAVVRESIDIALLSRIAGLEEVFVR
jgi:adenosylcobyric acid synthase